jgi:cell division protein FtsN
MAIAHRPAREYEFSLTVRQIAAIVASSLVVLSLAFALGVGFGHRLATAPVPTAQPTDLDQLDAKPSPSPQPALTYQNELIRNDTGRSAPPPKPPKEEMAESPKPAPSASPTPSPTPAVAERPSPSPVPTPAETPSVRPAMAAKSERWTIQFGAPKQKAEADKIVAKLVAAGLDPFVVEADIPGKGHFFRVRVGQFGSKEEAERTRTQAQERTKLTGVSMPMQ